MILNISQLLEYQKCPVSWHNKYILKRGPSAGAALSDGLFWHSLAEAYLTDESLLPPAANPVQDAMRHFVEEGKLPKLPVTHVEYTLSMPLGRHTLVGILDGILPIAGTEQNYSLQWKTCAGGQDMERQCDAVRYSYHEAAYEALMNHNGFNCAGTYLGVWQKLSQASQREGVAPLSFHILERPPKYVAQVLREVEWWADAIERTPFHLPNRRSCIQGFIRCPYWDSCYNDIPLTDNRYINLEDRYAKQDN